MHRILKSAAAIGALALAGPAIAQADQAATPDSGRPLTATLSGAAEVPGPGDEDGTGTFEARVNPGQGELCYTLTATGIETATAAHVHTGGPTEAGAPVVTLDAPAGGSSEGCASVERELAMALIQSPQDYYVNVHNADFPAGAIRGQLSK